MGASNWLAGNPLLKVEAGHTKPRTDSVILKSWGGVRGGTFLAFAARGRGTVRFAPLLVSRARSIPDVFEDRSANLYPRTASNFHLFLVPIPASHDFGRRFSVASTTLRLLSREDFHFRVDCIIFFGP